MSSNAICFSTRGPLVSNPKRSWPEVSHLNINTKGLMSVPSRRHIPVFCRAEEKLSENAILFGLRKLVLKSVVRLAVLTDRGGLDSSMGI